MNSSIKIKQIIAVFGFMAIGACSGGDELAPSDKPRVESGDVSTLANIRPYRTSSNYANVIKDCALAETEDDSCNTNTLPFIGQTTNTITKSDILDRLLISDAWMGTRFEDLIDLLPSDSYQLFAGVTAIVVSADIRPAYYNPYTAAIYIDPDYMWLTQAELDTISSENDYRAGFGSMLDFIPYARTLINNRDIRSTLDSSQTLANLAPVFASVVFHELSHSLDFYRALNGNRQSSISVIRQFESAIQNITSTKLKDTYPLSSAEMVDIADVMYGGDDPTSTISNYTAAQVGGFFAADRANDDYAYSSQFEDFAMLAEEALLAHYFSTEREMMFIDNLDDAIYCNDFIIRWGQKNRGNDPSISVRTQKVLTDMMDSSFASQVMASLSQPASTTGGNICLSQGSFTAKFSPSLPRRELRRAH